MILFNNSLLITKGLSFAIAPTNTGILSKGIIIGENKNKKLLIKMLAIVELSSS